jgi:hypothetical protein
MAQELNHKRRGFSPLVIALVVLMWPLSYGPLILVHDAGFVSAETLATLEVTFYVPWVVVYDRVPFMKEFGDWYIALWR